MIRRIKTWFLTAFGFLLVASAALTTAIAQPPDLSRSVPDFLPPDQAFVFSADYDGGSHVRFYWHLAQGYYLYRKAFTVQEVPGALLPDLIIPPGKRQVDEWFGEVEVYYGEAVVRAPVPAGLSQLKVTYQGCAEAGLCYPREHRYVQLQAGTAGLSMIQAAEQLQPEYASGSDGETVAVETTEDRLLMLLTTSTLVSVLGIFFLAGIGLAFTPCVLPMVPVLSAIIVGGRQISTLRAGLLSCAYVLGMAVVYAIAGALMGLFGAGLNVQAALQNPWLLAAFAALFIALALAMFGLYELRLPASWQGYIDGLVRRRGGGFTGVVSAGALSALIVSPCISAPLAGALVYISLHQDFVTGALALLFLALGMGVPLLLFGLGLGHLLPRAGAWMQYVKTVAGIALVGLAIWLLSRWLPVFWADLLWAAFVTGIAVWLLKLTFSRVWLRWLSRLTALVIFAYGVFLAVQGAHFQPALLADKSDTAAADFAVFQDVDQLSKQLAAGQAPRVLYFYADWCVSCRRLEQSVFPKPSVQSHLALFKRLKLDITRNTPAHQKLLDDFKLFGPPALLFFDAEGSEQRAYRIQSEVSAAVLEAHLKGFLADNGYIP